MDKKKLESVKKIYKTAAGLYQMIESDSLDEEMKGKMLYLIESHFAETAKIFDYESDLTKMKDERTVELRAAYKEIESLKRKLADSTAVPGLKEKMRDLIEKVENWWTKDGFNYISEPSYDRLGNLRCNLCFILRDDCESDDEDSHLQNLKNEGFVFCEGYGKDYATTLLDIDTNRILLTKMIKGRFPTAKIAEWRSRGVNRAKNDESVLREVSIVIYNLSEI